MISIRAIAAHFRLAALAAALATPLPRLAAATLAHGDAATPAAAHERLIVLERSSNFRDLGGYPAAGGKHVRWGMIYRTAAMPMLTEADYAAVRKLNIRSIVDLRSLEERQIAPDGVPTHTGARYFAVEYPADSIFHAGQSAAPNAATAPGAGATAVPGPGRILDLYRTWPVSLAPQYRRIFHDLLRHDGAVSYHCSAGQDRAGVATALILTALGVPRATIMQDYLLSTADRRPANEIPPLTVGEYPGNVVADFYLKVQAAGPPKPGPLAEPDGVPFLQAAFDAIEARWGSVDAYLNQELGIGPHEIAELRRLYLE